MKVSNGKCIRTLSHRSLRANRTRNIVAVLAIALTTVLFTSLFTIAMSINDGIPPGNMAHEFSGFQVARQTQRVQNGLLVYPLPPAGALVQQG